MPNDIIRHPRLSSDAVRLLTWQLSLPSEAKDSLSRTAERAGIGKCAFLRAKRELKAEGYLHEWREQVIHRPGGLVRYVLRDVPPPAAPVPAAAAAAAPRLPRVAQMRECESGRHTQPLLFRPVADESLCRICRSARAKERSVGGEGAQVAVRGAATVRAVLREAAAL